MNRTKTEERAIMANWQNDLQSFSLRTSLIFAAIGTGPASILKYNTYWPVSLLNIIYQCRLYYVKAY